MTVTAEGILVAQSKNEALAAVMKQAAIEAGLWVGTPYERCSRSCAEVYCHWAQRGDYRPGSRDWPSHPELFGMTNDQFRTVHALIYL